MIVNMRYYFLTLISIFMALGIGIFIGFMFDAQQVIGTQKNDIVSQLEDRFDYLKEENNTIRSEIDLLKNENNKYIEFSEKIFPYIIKNKLNGLRVAIIETNDDYIYTSLSNILEGAGAIVTSLTTIKDKIVTESEALHVISQSYMTKEIEGDKTKEPKWIIEEMTKSILTGKNFDLLIALKDEEMIELIGNYAVQVDYIIIAGGSSKKETNKLKVIDKSIIDYCKKVNTPIVAVEKEKVSFSYIEGYKESRISTIDNIDSIIGQISLILTMDGNPGNYGVKNNSDSLFPDLNPITQY